MHPPRIYLVWYLLYYMFWKFDGHEDSLASSKMTNVVNLIFLDIYDGFPVPTTGAPNTMSSWYVKHNKLFLTPRSFAHAYLSNDGAIVVVNNIRPINWRELNTSIKYK